MRPPPHAALLAPALALALVGCAPRLPTAGPLPEPEERQRAQRELAEQRRYLACTTQAVPLPGLPDALLVADRVPPWATGGLAPRLLPPGTPVRIERVEFATRAELARRPLAAGALRLRPWAWLSSPGEPGPLVLALSGGGDTAEELRAEVGQLLTAEDPTPRLVGLTEAQREAVLRQEVALGMDPAAVELAWGVPARRAVDRATSGPSSEAWSWRDGRAAWFEEGRLVRWTTVQPGQRPPG